MQLAEQTEAYIKAQTTPSHGGGQSHVRDTYDVEKSRREWADQHS